MSLGALEGATAQPAYGSFAFRARETSGQHRIGMVTAAHVISVGEYVYNWNDNIGICTQSTLADTVDAAFVVITDTANYDPSNYLYGDFSNLLSTSTSLPGTGTTVNKRGATTGHTSGYIVNTNARLLLSYFCRKRFESPLWQWCKEHDKTEDFIRVCNLRDSETVANIALIMLHQTDYLLRKLIDKFKSDFLKNGGIREQMSSARREWRDTHR